MVIHSKMWITCGQVGRPGRDPVNQNSQTPFEEWQKSRVLYLAARGDQGAPGISSTGSWLISAINFLLTEARSPGRMQQPGIAGRKRR